MKETLRHREAFEVYYGMGESRTLRAVAEAMDVSAKSIFLWSKEFNWQDRVVQRDVDNSRIMREQTDKAVINEKTKYRRIVRAAVAEWVKNLQEGKIEVRTVRDLETLVRMDMLLLGEATDRQEFSGQVEATHGESVEKQLRNDPETRELLRELYRRSRAVGSAGES